MVITKLKKTAGAAILSACLALSMAPMTAFADDTELTYEQIDEFTQYDADLIPITLEGSVVTVTWPSGLEFRGGLYKSERLLSNGSYYFGSPIDSPADKYSGEYSVDLNDFEFVSGDVIQVGGQVYKNGYNMHNFTYRVAEPQTEASEPVISTEDTTTANSILNVEIYPTMINIDVPTESTAIIDSNGDAFTADFEITNHSNAPVTLDGISLMGANNWGVHFGYLNNMLNNKNIAFQIEADSLYSGNVSAFEKELIDYGSGAKYEFKDVMSESKTKPKANKDDSINLKITPSDYPTYTHVYKPQYDVTLEFSLAG